MRIVPGALLASSLPLLLAAAPADAPSDPALRLTPAGEVSAMPVPPVPLSFGPQTIAFPGGVNATFDLVYGRLRGFRPLTLDLYQPQARNGGLPLVVFVHGGGWNGGDTRHAASFADFPRVLAALAAKGYAVASVSYRFSGEAPFPAAVQDIKAAIRWLRGQSRDLGIDSTRVAVWGDAAGGQLASLVGVTCGVAPFEPDARNGGDLPSDCVQAVIDWGGATDLENSAGAPAQSDKTAAGFAPPPGADAGDILGCEPPRCSAAVAHLASPLAFISAASPPFLIQQGGAGGTMAQSQKLHDALQKAGVPVELAIYPDVGGDFTRGGAPDPATLQAVLDRLGGFLATTFPAAPPSPRLTQSHGSLY